MSEQTVKCRICGEPYKVYAYFSGDQSACPSCVRKAERNMMKGPHVRPLNSGNIPQS